MLSIIGTLGLMMVIIIIGKRKKEFQSSTYLLLAFIALLQVVLVLYEMYTMTMPVREILK